MMREAVRALETGHLAEIGIVAFTIAFVLIVIRAFMMPKKARDDAKNMPLEDEHDIS